jgi:uncharacterized protein (DUF697 family)
MSTEKNELGPVNGGPSELTEEIIKLFSTIPESREEVSKSPEQRAKEIVRKAQVKTASISAGWALVPGPMGLLSVIPDLYSVWKVQSQMVADIAAVYGKTADLTQESMAYCLVKQMANWGGGQLLVKAGEHYILKKGGTRFIQQLAKRLSIDIAQKSISKACARWIPFAGSAVMGGVSAWDTGKIGKRAMKVFAATILSSEQSSEVDSGQGTVDSDF